MAAGTSFIDSMGGTSGLIGAGLSLIPTIGGLLTAGKQRRRANDINPVDAGFAANPALLNNSRVLNETYSNFTLPGKSGIIDRQNQGLATAMGNIEQGATSGTDVLDGATRLAYIGQQGINSLGMEEAQMKQQLLPQVLQADAAAGNEIVRRNQFDEERYQQKSAEKSALNQAADLNTFNSVDALATLGGTLLNYRAQPYKKSQLKGFQSLGSQFDN